MNNAAPKTYQVSELVREVKKILEQGFKRSVLVEGEISNFSTPSSGHWYFTLKDDQAQMRCIMFRNQNSKLAFKLEDGLQVIARCRLSIYETRGDFQSIVAHLDVAGDGALRLAFEQLFNKLQAEGLFAEERKKAIPTFPTHIGLIASETSASVRDALTVLRRRYPAAKITLMPTSTQGNQAPKKLVKALRQAQQFNAEHSEEPLEVLLVIRGGGSLEDLKAFNDERVARAIAACPIAIISGIGHEPDFTIADYVADQRAPTPSAAAELAAPQQWEWLTYFQQQQANLTRIIYRSLERRGERVQQNKKRLRDPVQYLQNYQQRMDDLSLRSKMALQAKLNHKSTVLERLNHRIRATSPAPALQALGLHLQQLKTSIHSSMGNQIKASRQQLATSIAELNVLSPLGTLNRGYALAASNGNILTQVRQAAPKQQIDIYLSDGRLNCQVIGIGTKSRLGDLNAGLKVDLTPKAQAIPDQPAPVKAGSGQQALFDAED